MVHHNRNFNDSNWSDRHGPAMTQRPDESPDVIFALKCSCWPVAANEWLTRTRRNNWPAKQDLKRLKQLSCILAPVGHPYSSEQHLMWRISFSLQEMSLVANFNQTQFQCYTCLR